jgi:hypothetical protein
LSSLAGNGKTFHLISKVDYEHEFLDTTQAHALAGTGISRGRGEAHQSSHPPSRQLNEVSASPKFSPRAHFFSLFERQTPASGTFKGVRSYLFFNPIRKRFPRAPERANFSHKKHFRRSPPLANQAIVVIAEQII